MILITDSDAVDKKYLRWGVLTSLAMGKSILEAVLRHSLQAGVPNTKCVDLLQGLRNFKTYKVSFRLRMATKPINPEPKSHIAPGIGTAAMPPETSVIFREL